MSRWLEAYAFEILAVAVIAACALFLWLKVGL